MIQMNHVRFSYRNHTVFDDLGLGLSPGYIYGLFGLNGAGKSTLLKLLSGLIFPQRGRIQVLGREPRCRAPEFLSQIYMLTEAPHLPGVTNRQYITRFAPLYPNFNQDYMDRLLATLEIPNAQKLTSLSLGEQKKFHLAFGLACQPSILILDEPTNGLDIPSKGLFRKLVAEALTEDRILILSTHQVKDVELLIDRVVVLHDGTIICNQSLAEIAAGFRFSQEATQPDPQSAGLIYAEPGLYGYAAIWATPDAEDGQPDLELLFKAAISNPAAFDNHNQPGTPS